MKVWTDLPFISLGDGLGDFAPVREAQITAYDGKTTCVIVVGGSIEKVRIRNLYTKPRRASKEFALTKKDLKGFNKNV